MNPKANGQMQREWGWWIAIYLFLGGIGGGAYTIGAVNWLIGESVEASTTVALWIGFPALLIGSICLLFDLGSPTRAILAGMRPGTSWMARGFWIISVFMILAFRSGPYDSTVFIGPKGRVEVRRSGLKTEPESLLDDGPEEGKGKLEVSHRHDNNFLESIKSSKPAIAPVDEAVRSDIISHLCDIAIRKGRKITWDPKKEVIVGDDEAARMLTRPMRAPWKL